MTLDNSHAILSEIEESIAFWKRFNTARRDTFPLLTEAKIHRLEEEKAWIQRHPRVRKSGLAR